MGMGPDLNYHDWLIRHNLRPVLHHFQIILVLY